jgi:hypothetical protein
MDAQHSRLWCKCDGRRSGSGVINSWSIKTHRAICWCITQLTLMPILIICWLSCKLSICEFLGSMTVQVISRTVFRRGIAEISCRSNRTCVVLNAIRWRDAVSSGGGMRRRMNRFVA